jgi:hypothetical protein
MKLPQLTLRDLFWLVLVCAMGCGWLVSQWRANLKQKALKADLEALQNEERIWRFRATTLKKLVEGRWGGKGGHVEWDEGGLTHFDGKSYWGYTEPEFFEQIAVEAQRIMKEAQNAKGAQ